MSKALHPDANVGTVQCPKCKRPYMTSFPPGQKMRDVKCRDCIKQEIDEAEERDRHPQG